MATDRVNQMLKHATGMAAAAGAYRALEVAWRRLSGKTPPLGPDDQHVALGRAIAWTVVMGAVVTTARMIAMRYTARLLPSGREATKDSAGSTVGDIADI
jgi:hypothetical protein